MKVGIFYENLLKNVYLYFSIFNREHAGWLVQRMHDKLLCKRWSWNCVLKFMSTSETSAFR